MGGQPHLLPDQRAGQRQLSGAAGNPRPDVYKRQAFEVSISVDDLTPENFNTPEAMLALVERLQNE